MKYLLGAALLSFSAIGIAGGFTDDEHIYDMPAGLIHAIDDLAARGLTVKYHGCKVEIMRCYDTNIKISKATFTNKEFASQTRTDDALKALAGVMTGDTVYLNDIYTSGYIPLSVFAMDDKAVFILKD
jgi:hypothetical protein